MATVGKRLKSSHPHAWKRHSYPQSPKPTPLSSTMTSSPELTPFSYTASHHTALYKTTPQRPFSSTLHTYSKFCLTEKVLYTSIGYVDFTLSLSREAARLSTQAHHTNCQPSTNGSTTPTEVAPIPARYTHCINLDASLDKVDRT